MREVRVAIADDQLLFRSGLAMILGEMGGINVVLEAGDGVDLLQKLQRTTVDVIFMDFRMPEMNGICAARHVREKDPRVKILMLTSYDDEEIIMGSFASGANGFLTKDDEPAEIKLAIESVMNTGYYFNDRTSKLIVIGMTAGNKLTPRFTRLAEDASLNPGELMVIRLLAKEYSTREIAEIMIKSERTIDAYRAEIMRKTGTRNVAGIVMYGVKHGIIEV